MTRDSVYGRSLGNLFLKRPAATSIHISVHLITLSDKKNGIILALKGFVENKGQSSPFSVDSKTQGKCQLSVKILAICQLTPSTPSSKTQDV